MLAAVDRGMPRREATAAFGVSPATLKRWLTRRRETGSAAPRRRPRIGFTSGERRALWRQLEENPEATPEHRRETREREQGVRVSIATMSRAIRRLGWTYEQRLRRPPSETSRPAPPSASG